MSTFRNEEVARLTEFATERYGVSTHILPFHLIDYVLHDSVRATAVDYFHRHGIKWWTGPLDAGRSERKDNEPAQPTGYLTSSQVACVNHLEPARLDRGLAAAVLAGLDQRLVEPLAVDAGYAAYEWIGAENYLGEPGTRTRGANVTSLDALMRARRDDGAIVVVAIEWKYTENPDPRQKLTSDRGTDRVAVYRALLERPGCPIRRGSPERLFYEPYYQLMRQTLLAWQMHEHGELDADDWIHIQVVPTENTSVRGRTGAAPELPGETAEEAWRSALVQPERFRQLTPSELLAGVGTTGPAGWRDWLRERYLT